MSTPTTATAALPHAHYHSRFNNPPYHQGHSSATTTTTTYRTTASLLPAAAANSFAAAPPSQNPARPLSYYHHHQPAAHAGYTSSVTDGVAHSAALQPPHAHAHAHDHHYGHHDAAAEPPRFDDIMPSTPSSAVVPAQGRSAAAAKDQPSRKRRRSREPDWNSFYRNGLPKEIIVIDDTPEPEANTGRRITAGGANVAAESASAKKRRRDDPVGYHVQYLGGNASHTNTPLNTTPNGSTRSSDRTNSALNTTAPTSLSSNSQYDDLAAPLKRKRTTRQQAANEAKRRDVDGLGGAFMAYKPPPFPPKKSAEVPVKVIPDVSPRH